MTRLEVGMIVSVAGQRFPERYRIEGIKRGCRCGWLPWDPPLPEHVHLTLSYVDRFRDQPGRRAWLNHYDEATLRSVRHPQCRLIVHPPDRPVQGTLAL